MVCACVCVCVCVCVKNVLSACMLYYTVCVAYICHIWGSFRASMCDFRKRTLLQYSSGVFTLYKMESKVIISTCMSVCVWGYFTDVVGSDTQLCTDTHDLPPQLFGRGYTKLYNLKNSKFLRICHNQYNLYNENITQNCRGWRCPRNFLLCVKFVEGKWIKEVTLDHSLGTHC